MHESQRRIAFEILYAENAAPVYRFALRLCGNKEDAEDMAAEALVQAYRKWSGYKGHASPRTWLCAIVLNQWRMRQRRGMVHEVSLDSIQEVAASFEFVDYELAEAIYALSDRLREAFLLVKGEGFTHAEAAKTLRVPVGTVYFRVHSAVHQLRKTLGSPARVQMPVAEGKVSDEM
ncbi:MAG TPA: RNA polymerase sigma factor [Fimbriimonadaceae bacterium]|jgi:RNA polymerase sigma-70 factor (ECF subfamily)